MTHAFKITSHKGFHLTFANGCTVSVQFGPGNYGSNYDAPFQGLESVEWKSQLAEVACWRERGGLVNLGSDTVAGYIDADRVGKLIEAVRTFKGSTNDELSVVARAALAENGGGEK